MSDFIRPTRFSRLLSRCYPRELREQYADDIARFIDDARRDPRNRNPLRGVTVAARLTLDALRSLTSTSRSDALSFMERHNSSQSIDVRSPEMRSPRVKAEAVMQDVSYAIRTLRRRPVFVAAISLTLAVGIGANAAVFSLVDAVILHPVAVGNPQSLMAIYEKSNTSQYDRASITTYRTLTAANTSFTGFAAAISSEVVQSVNGNDETIIAQFVTENYFTVLDVHAALGRLIASSDKTVPGENAVVVLSDEMWRTKFGGDPKIIGQRLLLQNQKLTVIGILPADFRGTDITSKSVAWIPLSMATLFDTPTFTRYQPTKEGSQMRLFSVFGRLEHGVTVQRALADLTRSAKINVMPITQAAVGPSEYDGMLRNARLLFSVVAVTLLLACVNISNLLVVRARERNAELGIRAALGASMSRLARQLFAESLILAFLGGIIGVAVTALVLKLVSSFALPNGMALSKLHLALDWRVLGFTFALACATSLLFGLLPAVQAARGSLNAKIREGDDARRPALVGRGMLLSLQVAISLMLVVGAGLFLRSVQQGFNADFGFDPKSLATVSVKPDFDGKQAERAHLYLSVATRAERSSGIAAVAVTSSALLGGAFKMSISEGAETSSPSPDRKTMMMPMNSVSNNYFSVVKIPLLAGRTFGEQDTEKSERVTIINETVAHAFWPGESPLGKQMTFVDMMTYRVVGVVRDIKYYSLYDAAVPYAYAPILQEDMKARVTFIARSSSPKSALLMLHQSINEVAPMLTPEKSQLVLDRISDALSPQRYGATLLGVFAMLALLLSAIGTYGTVAYVVARRTKEIGIRMALGASTLNVLAIVLREIAAAVGGGILLGTIASGFATTLVAHFLYNVATSDWIAFTGAIATVIGVALLASMWPASRASRVDPLQAIRLS
ncbi:MAG: ABC transporter permease [Gemmatimonadaceae bacterium]